jgi:DNA polymerase III epsilon subunit-like protein
MYEDLVLTPKDKIELWSNIVSEKIYEGKQIVVFFDTETTGGVRKGRGISVVEKDDIKYEGKRHRMLEIGASVTVLNEENGQCDPLTDNSGDLIRFHEYLNIWAEGEKELKKINSMIDVPYGAYRVHGISEEFLNCEVVLGHDLDNQDSNFKLERKAPTMKQAIDPLMKVTGLQHIRKNPDIEKRVIFAAHNAEFDNKFMNSEFQLAGLSPFESYAASLCTLAMSRDIIPPLEVSKKYSLDSLYKYVLRENFVKNDEIPRELHGAMVDTRILLTMYNGLTNSKWYKDAPNTPLKEKKMSEGIVDYLKDYQDRIIRRPLPKVKF